MILSEELKSEATGLGLCNLWKNNWGNPSPEALIMKYKKGIQWCMERNFPSASFILDRFGREKLEEYSIYVDKKAVSQNEPIVIIRGDSEFDMTYDYYNVGTVWIGNNSRATIKACENAIVNVYVFDNADVEVIREGNSKVNVRRDG